MRRAVSLMCVLCACSGPRSGAGDRATTQPATTTPPTTTARATALDVPTGGGDIVTVPSEVADAANEPATTHRVGNPGDLCGTAKPFLAELQEFLFPSKALVKYEWKPVVAGSDPRWPTIGEHHFYVAGTIKEWTTPGDDVPFAHPFGNDCSTDILVDDRYTNLVFDGPEPPGVIHAELESGLFPHLPGDPLEGCGTWISPAAGDRIVEFGDWILDCGHPESYGTEIHPPAIMAIGHLSDDGSRTESRAFAIPYRTTQLYAKDGKNASNVDDPGRFGASDVHPFPDYFQSELVRNLTSEDDHIVVHPMIAAAHFDNATWSVCAPQPRPATATGLAADWHFTTRDGVTVTATPHDDTGCVTFTATQAATYRSLPIVRQDRPWPWCNAGNDGVCNAWSVDAMAQSVAGDCSLRVEDKVDEIAFAVGALIGEQGGASMDATHHIIAGLTWLVVHQHVSATPVIDHYAPLPIPGDGGGGGDCLGKCRQQRLACAESDDPQLLKRCGATYTSCIAACKTPALDRHVTIDNTQPFPFYGTATASWQTSGPPPAIARAELQPAQLSWSFRQPDGVRPVTLANVGSASLGITLAGITGPDRADFAIASDTCSGKTLAPHETCTTNVVFKRTNGLGAVARPAGWHKATLAYADATGGTLAMPLAGWDQPICAPRKACVSGSTCGVEPDGCGGTISCGSCKANASLCMLDEDTLVNRCENPKAGCLALCSRQRRKCQTSSDPNTIKLCGPAYTACTKGCNPPPYQPPVCTRARVQLDPAALAWSFDNAGAKKDVKLTDISTKPVVVGKVSITGKDAGMFSIAQDGCTGKRLVVPAGNCTITVAHAPSAPPARTPEATLQFDDDGWASPQTVPLTGACRPRTACIAGATCGTQDDGCGTGTISCGSCSAGLVCTTAGRCASADSRGACTTKCQQAREACTESGDPQLLKRCTSTYRSCIAACPH